MFVQLNRDTFSANHASGVLRHEKGNGTSEVQRLLKSFSLLLFFPQRENENTFTYSYINKEKGPIFWLMKKKGAFSYYLPLKI